jgi:hypothetical protein
VDWALPFGAMTAREKVHRLLDELPDSEVEPVLEFIVSHRKDEGKALRAVAPGSGSDARPTA